MRETTASGEGTGTLEPGTEEIRGFSQLLDSMRRTLEGALTDWLDPRCDAARAELPEAGDLADQVRRLVLAGGKRLRPALVAFSYRGCGGEDLDAVLPAAMSTELLHTYLLIHDDLMDHADLRRGEPTAHVVFRDHHRRRGWSGDSQEFGRSAAILAGDLAHSWAGEMFSESLLHPATAGRAASVDRCFQAMSKEVIGGQFLELQLALRRQATEDELLDVLRLKSGRYSVERPIQLGALLAGADEATLEALSRYGNLVGEAFQLQDDILGLFGDAATVGKPVGSDLEEGKYTFLIHHALERLDAAGADRIRNALGRSDLPATEGVEVVASIRQSGALDVVLGMVEERLREARRVIADLEFKSPQGKAFLTGLVEHLWERRQ
ncbi:MAG: polyprenyl synthetase family protein [Acidobacteriota bacterium]